MPRLPALSRLESLDLRGIKLGLAAIDAICERLGRPERALESVLVAGTNGKGSTAATLSAIAEAAGRATGLYTSPHLESVTERVRIRGDDIAAGELDAMLAEVFTAADRPPALRLTYFEAMTAAAFQAFARPPALRLTYFEAMTAAAFQAFARRRLDLAVLEVGLGGRLDATNVSPASVSVVTSIGIDHVEDLGPTLEAIAGEKAGIFRPGRPALTSSREPRVRATLRDAAARIGAELHEMADEARVEVESVGLEGTRLRLETPVRAYVLETPLPGRHQAENVATAVRAAELLRPGIEPGAIARGVASTRWPGRLEAFRVRGRTVLLDGCHNETAAAALARFVEDAGLAPDLVFGAMADKDVEGMAKRLGPAVRRIRLVPLLSPRAARPDELARRFASARPDAAAAESLAAAVEELLAPPAAETIIIAGSLYLVGEARALLSGRLDEKQ